MKKRDLEAELNQTRQALQVAQQQLAAKQATLESVQARLVKLAQQVEHQRAQLNGAFTKWKNEKAKHRQTVAELESERDFALRVMNTMGQGLTVSDVHGRFVYVNPAYAKMVGYEPEELLGKTPYDVTHPDDQEILTRSFHRRMAGEPGSYETCLRHQDGHAVYVMITAVPRWHQGQVIGSIAVIADLTERKHLEDLLKETRDEALMNARVKSQFLANVSHEIRTPLNGVIGMTSLLLDTHLTRDQYEFVQTIRQSGDSLLSLINDILDFSKIEAGELVLENHPFDLSNCIAEAMELFTKEADDKNIKIGHTIAENVPPSIVGDVTRLRQILVNLLSNAVKFTEQGEIHIEVTAKKLSAGEFRIQFAVSDTGIGIPAHRMEDIFQPFRQVDASMTRRYGGTGLGLPISQQLSRLMGGHMWAESKEGDGSAFFFTVLVEAEVTPQEPDIQIVWKESDSSSSRTGDTRPLAPRFDPDMGKHHPLHILLAEDNAINQKVALRILSRLGYRAEVAANGLEVLSALQRQSYDVIIMDVQMPEMDGVEATQKIREQWSPSAQPHIIAMTAHAMEGDRERYLELGMDDYISKPVKIEALVAALYESHPLPKPES